VVKKIWLLKEYLYFGWKVISFQWAFVFLMAGYATKVLAYTRPKGFVPVINQAGK
jgi:hypothetical protein